jgi:outer membrane protein
VNQAEANWRPSVNLNGSYGYQALSTNTARPFLPQATTTAHPLTAGVSLTENIYRGGRTAAEISKAKAAVRAGVAQLSLTEEGVLLDGVTAYMNVVR